MPRIRRAHVLLAAPLLSLAAPDYWVGVGTGETNGRLGKTVKAPVVVGVTGAPITPGKISVFLNVYDAAVTTGDKLVCRADAQMIEPPTQGSALTPLEFRVNYPRGPFPLPAAKSKNRASGRVDPRELALVRYRIEPQVVFYPGGITTGDVETSTGNNQNPVTRSFAPGGTPSCVRL